MIRAVIVDDHELVRTGLEQWLLSHDYVEAVGVDCVDGQAVEVVLELTSDALIMHISMPALEGFAETSAMRSGAPEMQLIALIAYHDRTRIDAALIARSIGLLLNDVGPRALVDGISSVVDDVEALASAEVADGPGSALTSSTLTPRELEILLLIASGHENKKIARMLSISDKTVKSHCARLFQRIGVTNRTQAAVWAIKNLAPDIDERTPSLIA